MAKPDDFPVEVERGGSLLRRVMPARRWIERGEYGSGNLALLRSLLNRRESGELDFREGQPRCHCAIWRAPRALSGC
jgi:hypothetical protein